MILYHFYDPRVFWLIIMKKTLGEVKRRCLEIIEETLNVQEIKVTDYYSRVSLTMRWEKNADYTPCCINYCATWLGFLYLQTCNTWHSLRWKDTNLLTKIVTPPSSRVSGFCALGKNPFTHTFTWITSNSTTFFNIMKI